MHDDRRQHPRFPILLVAMAHTSEASFEVVCTNVSAGGAFLATRTAAQANAPIELELKPHGPEGPTVMLLGQVRYAVPRGTGSQPGFSVTWTEAQCPTSRLALEQVLSDILRVPKFRVSADGLGGRFRFGVPMADDQPEEPARVIFPPSPPEPVARSEFAVAPEFAASPEFSAPTEQFAVFADLADAVQPAEPVRAAPAHDFDNAEEAEAPGAPADLFSDFAALTIGDEAPDERFSETALDAPHAAEPSAAHAGYEAETMELSAAMAVALAREIRASDAREAASASAETSPVPAFEDPAFDWSEFESIEGLTDAEEAAAADPRDMAETIEISVARLRAADPTLDVYRGESTSPAASFGARPAATTDEDDDDVGFTGGDAPLVAPVDDDYFPDHIPEPEPAPRMTRNTVMRRLSGGFDSDRAAVPAAPKALNAPRGAQPSGAREPVHAEADAFAASLKPAPPRTTSSLTRSFLAKVSTGEHQKPQGLTPRSSRTVAEALPSETSTYADHDVAAHRALVNRETDEAEPYAGQDAQRYAPTASAPRARPPELQQAPIAEPRLGKPMAMVDAGQEVPRVMTESTVAYARESQGIGPLLHAQTLPIEGDWPEIIPPSLAERYGYLEHIGTGGHGVAYRAVDLHLNRTVVLKFLAHSALPTELARKYFLREVKMAASLNHPNIVHIYDIGKVDDVLYYAMEYVDGVPLSAYLPLREPIRDLQFVYSVVAQLCEALDHAHGQQILHRDIKPDNVLVAVDGVVKLFDFGLARIADEGFGEQSVLIGTPHYMAPEQLMGGRVDHRADIYALGVMIFRLLTGVLPFQDGNVFAAHAVEPVPDPRMFNPSLPAAIVPVIEKAMAKQPAQRYGNCRELAHDLYAALFGSPVN